MPPVWQYLSTKCDWRQSGSGFSSGAPTMISRIDHFVTLVQRDPQNEMFRFSLAQALVNSGRSPEAIEHYEFCITKKPDWMMARILLAKVHLQLGQKTAARPLLDAALRLAVQQHHEDPEKELRALLAEL